jgi:rubredoxin
MPLPITCPGCREPLDVDEEYRTWKVRCPRCEYEFVPDGGPRRPPRSGGDEDDDYDDRPRRRRRRPRFGRQDFDDALTEVYSPGLCTELLGWLGVLATLGGMAAFVAIAAAANQPRQQQQNEDAVVMAVLAGCVAVFGLPYSIAMTIAGRHLRRLTSRGWATAGAALGIGGFVLFGVFGLFHLGVGIWALVVINRPQVKAAFDYNARGPDGDDD